MRLLQEIYINFVLLPYFIVIKNNNFITIKWLYIYPDSKFRKWKFKLINEYDEEVYEN